jgi:phage repressor protein C with HTH and peptisase S24 domain/DNA-binding XRE family transcriptional regulator
MTLGQRIRERRQVLGISRPKLAERAGIPYSTLAGIENGDQQGSTELHKLARVLQCTVDYLVSGRETQVNEVRQGWLTDLASPVDEPFLRPIVVWDDPKDLPPESTVFLKKLDFHLSAGNGGPDPDAVEQTDKVTPFRADFVAAQGWTPRTHFTMRCSGESMEPTIQDAAPVVIATNERTIRSGKIYAILLDGEPLLKRLDKLPGGKIRVRSDNPAPAYEAFIVEEAEVQVIGRAVWTPVML